MLLRDILRIGELRDLIVSKVKEVVGKDLVGIIVYGSTLYLGVGRDLDLIVIVSEEQDLRSRFNLEIALRKSLETLIKGSVADVHILSISEFRDNLRLGSPLSGLALGYEILYGGSVLEPLILNFLKELARDKYVLHNEYGTWNLSHYAGITYNLKVRKLKQVKG
ncbi:MAG: hypothetical protein J7J11_02395 [Desulfurococcales archaeon]|nr:hypothetical protein [Desulfurococcales archaeon]